jgi:phenylpropionate dioxygenase-like ring-hydroxylating dioxygenase large terminal subunit
VRTQTDEGTDRPPLPDQLRPPRPQPAFAVLNARYPAAYWQIAQSTDVAVGEVIPLRVLERDIVLWRDSGSALRASSAHCGHLGAHLGFGGEVVDDTLRCPFHAWRYDSAGQVVAIPGIEGRVTTKACLQVFRVVERYGAVFLWNGPGVPDQDFPDVLADAGLDDADVEPVHLRFKLPFPARQLVENNPDAAHFSALHGFGAWGDTETVEHTPTRLDMIAHFYQMPAYPSWSVVKRAYRRGELFGVLLDSLAGGDVRSLSYSGGLHLYTLTPPPQELLERQQSVTKIVPRLWIAMTRAAASRAYTGAYTLSHTPVEANSHVLHATFFVPRVTTPLLRKPARRVAEEALARSLYFAVWQDASVMMHRQEPARPAFHRFDRALIEYRKFWDARVAVAAAAGERR